MFESINEILTIGTYIVISLLLVAGFFTFLEYRKRRKFDKLIFKFSWDLRQANKWLSNRDNFKRLGGDRLPYVHKHNEYTSRFSFYSNYKIHDENLYKDFEKVNEMYKQFSLDFSDVFKARNRERRLKQLLG
ncbi:MAG: hypothetical protein SLAVMIC_00741 [uncultured marine phage]|uniref:Uncharacterized protein n=1 Tax=uncultured marine phage TaxID=707152 RepID=A0A8D9CFN6_9VIRU|nr:MAG: hypothetical protein SLAVMIC_00741 [uncultured marine phage]